MQYLKSKEQIIEERLGSVHESVMKIGDTFKVKTFVEIPKSLINQFVSKAKKEHNLDTRENWSDTDLAEMFVDYVIANYLNIESLPVNSILGTDGNSTELTTTVEEPISTQEPEPALTTTNDNVIETPIENTNDNISSEIIEEF